MKIAMWFLGIVTALVIVGYAAFQLSPWPSALLIRWAFSHSGKEISDALVKHVPPNVASITNERYDPNDADAKLDVYFPSEIEHSDKVADRKFKPALWCSLLRRTGLVVSPRRPSSNPAQ